MKKPLHPVSDHAVVRYLERVEGMDIERIRREIGRKVDFAVQHGASGAVVGGFVYRLSPGGTVTTVAPQNLPERNTKRGKRQRDKS